MRTQNKMSFNSSYRSMDSIHFHACSSTFPTYSYLHSEKRSNTVSHFLVSTVFWSRSNERFRASADTTNAIDTPQVCALLFPLNYALIPAISALKSCVIERIFAPWNFIFVQQLVLYPGVGFDGNPYSIAAFAPKRSISNFYFRAFYPINFLPYNLLRLTNPTSSAHYLNAS